MRAYRRAIELDPSFQRAYWNLAYALNHVGEYEEAIQAASNGLALPESEPRHTANLLNVRAFSFGRLKRYGEAITDLDEAIRLDADGIEHLFSRAQVNKYRGEFREALRDADAVLTIHPEHAGALRLKSELAGYEDQSGT